MSSATRWPPPGPIRLPSGSEQRVTSKERYTLLVERCQWPARRLMIFGLHIHVGVEGGEKAIAVVNALTTHLSHLLALSASSPFFNSLDTGLASCRVKVFESLPTAGLPYRLVNWAEFQHLMTTLINAKAIESIREVWWDVRPHPDFGTVEVRICDGLPTLDDVVAMTAMIQSAGRPIRRRCASASSASLGRAGEQVARIPVVARRRDHRR